MKYLVLAIALMTMAGCATPKHSAHYEYDYPDIRHVAPELRKD